MNLQTWRGCHNISIYLDKLNRYTHTYIYILCILTFTMEAAPRHSARYRQHSAAALQRVQARSPVVRGLRF